MTVTVTVTQQPATVAPTGSKCCRVETPFPTTTAPDTVIVTVTQTIFPGSSPMPSTPAPTTSVTPTSVTPAQPRTVFVTVTEIFDPNSVTTPTPAALPATVTVTQTVTAMPRTDEPGQTPVTKYVCPAGYVLRGDSCYLYSQPSRVATAEEAEQNCIKDGGRLLVISNAKEWQFVQRQLEAIRAKYPGQAYDGFWIGLRYDDRERRWNWIRPGGWQDIPWMLRARQARLCGEIWHDGTAWGIGQDTCDHKQWYICERERADRVSTPAPTAGSQVDGRPISRGGQCETGWEEFRGRCYLVSKPSSRLGSTEAEKICANWQAMLVVIDDLEEWEFVEAEAKRKAVATGDQGFDGFWIGLNRNNANSDWRWIRQGGLPSRAMLASLLRHSPLTLSLSDPGFPSTSGGCESFDGRQTLQQPTAARSGRTFDRGAWTKINAGTSRATSARKPPPGDSDPARRTAASSAIAAPTPRTASRAAETGAASARWASRSINSLIWAVGRQKSPLQIKQSKVMGSLMQGDGYNCVDVDECGRRQAFCGANADCVNTQGSYQCFCFNGYKKDESTGKCVGSLFSSPTAITITFSSTKQAEADEFVEFGTCIAYGDPHYRTFDGAAVHYMGTCRNILVDSNIANCYSPLCRLLAVVMSDIESRRSSKNSAWQKFVAEASTTKATISAQLSG